MNLCLWCGAICSWGLRGSHGLPGVLAGAVCCGQLGCADRRLCGAGVGHLFLGKDCICLSNDRKWTWWAAPASLPVPFFSQPVMFISTNVGCIYMNPVVPILEVKGWDFLSPYHLWGQLAAGKAAEYHCRGPGCLWEGVLLYSNRMFSFEH